jgi:hypothetical protein
VRNLSNHHDQGMVEARLTGRFMGSGPARVHARFRPVPPSSDFEAEVQIENTDLRSLNDLLGAYGKFDVVSGVFALYSEVRAKGNEIRGYVKPLFRDVKVYDPVQDREKSGLRKVYERVVEGASKLLENSPRDEVATRVDISGRVENPDAGTRLLQNAFFQAILPGLERERSRRPRS